MPRKRYPVLLAFTYLLTFIAGGHSAALLIQTLFDTQARDQFGLTNFLHSLFFLSILFCLFQRQIVPFFGYFLLALLFGLLSAYTFGPRYQSIFISQIPFMLIGFFGCYAALRTCSNERVEFHVSVNDLLRAIIFVSLASIAYKHWLRP